MALTINGKRTGRAAQIEAADFRGYLATQAAKPPVPATECKMCGRAVEIAPMEKGICYDCYRAKVDTENKGILEWLAPTVGDMTNAAYMGGSVEPTYDQIIRNPKLLTPELRKINQEWWNEHYSDENVKKRMEAQPTE